MLDMAIDSGHGWKAAAELMEKARDDMEKERDKALEVARVWQDAAEQALQELRDTRKELIELRKAFDEKHGLTFLA